MPKKSAIAELEESIARYYERYSARKVATAALLVGVFTLGLSYVFFALTHMLPVAIVAFGVVGFISVNLSMIFVVPPKQKLVDARELICAAIREPRRIKAFDIKGVKLADKEGKVQTLSGVDLAIWRNMVVPYFVQSQAGGSETATVKTDRKLTASERKYIEERRREVLKVEKKIEDERKQLETERKDMEARSKKLRQLEKSATEKIAQADAVNTEAIEKVNSEREAELKKREAELEARQKQIEAEAEDLKERSTYVSNVEDSLVDRLNELSTREASIEQGEVNAGLRRD